MTPSSRKSMVAQFFEKIDTEEIPETSKGQLISKCPFGVKSSSKKPMKFFPGFLP
jgi:hypothetical protein